MSSIRSKLSELYALEQLAALDSFVHSLHPLAKIIAVTVYILCVISLPPTAFVQLAPYAFFPVMMLSLGEIPFSMIFSRTAAALPFSLFAGLSNLLLRREIIAVVGTISLSYGAISLAVLLLRTLLCVSAALILVSVTPMPVLCVQLRRMHIPQILVTLLEITYRYVGTLLDEAFTMHTAYLLRKGDSKTDLHMRHMGSFIGQLLLRSFDRAQRVFHAMECRGYPASVSAAPKLPFRCSDWLFLFIACGSSLFFRFVNLWGWL